MDVAVDQSGRDARFREVEPGDVGWRVEVRADGADALALDQHRARAQRSSAGPVDERASRDEDGARLHESAKSRRRSSERWRECMGVEPTTEREAPRQRF